MKVVEYTAFSENLAANPDMVNDDKEMMIVPTHNGRTVVVMDLEEYNSIQETLHLTSTVANTKRLEEAIEEMGSGSFLKKQIIGPFSFTLLCE